MSSSHFKTKNFILQPAKVWYLHRQIDKAERFNTNSNLEFRLQKEIDPIDYIQLYNEIGSKWKWANRLIISKSELIKILQEETRELYYVYFENLRIGYFEIDFSPNIPEVVYLGIVPSFMAKGYGSQIMEFIFQRVQSLNRNSLMLHSCSNDSALALAFYQKKGFIILKETIEDQAIIIS